MAFTPSTWRPLTRKRSAGGNRQWHYTTADAIATVIGSGYFNKVYRDLQKYDVIFVVDTATPTYDVIFVTSATGASTVTTANAT